MITLQVPAAVEGERGSVGREAHDYARLCALQIAGLIYHNTCQTMLFAK